MNTFLKIENNRARFSYGQSYSEETCRQHLEQCQRAIEAFRVEKLCALARNFGYFTRREDGSLFVPRPMKPSIIFTPNDAGECFVEHCGRTLIISLDEPLESLVEQVREFLEPAVQYRTLEEGEILQVGDVAVVRGESSPTDFVGGEAHPVTYRRPLLPNSITSKNFTLSNNTNQ